MKTSRPFFVLAVAACAATAYSCKHQGSRSLVKDTDSLQAESKPVDVDHHDDLPKDNWQDAAVAVAAEPEFNSPATIADAIAKNAEDSHAPTAKSATDAEPTEAMSDEMKRRIAPAGFQLDPDQLTTGEDLATAADGPNGDHFALAGGGGVDLRRYDSPIKNQKRGDCVAHAIVAAIENMMSQRVQGASKFDLSEEHLWYLMGRRAGAIGDSVKLAQSSYLAAERRWPYMASATNPLSACCGITGFTAMRDVTDALRAGKTVVMATEVNKSWEKPFLGVINPGAANYTEADRFHAVAVVGVSVEAGRNYLIIKNSWGADWANWGYAYIPFEYCDKYECEFMRIDGLNLVSTADQGTIGPVTPVNPAPIVTPTPVTPPASVADCLAQCTDTGVSCRDACPPTNNAACQTQCNFTLSGCVRACRGLPPLTPPAPPPAAACPATCDARYAACANACPPVGDGLLPYPPAIECGGQCVEAKQACVAACP